MPRIKLTKSAIDAIPTPASDMVYWDAGCSRVRRQGHAQGAQGVHCPLPHRGRRLEAAQIHHWALREGDPSPGAGGRAEGVCSEAGGARLGRREAGGAPARRCRQSGRPVGDFHRPASGAEPVGRGDRRLLRRELGKAWAGRSIHEITKRDVVEVVSAVEQRGALGAANKTLKSTKTFLRWCVGRAILDRSPAEGIPLPKDGR